jgi:chemotaxis protein MotB
VQALDGGGRAAADHRAAGQRFHGQHADAFLDEHWQNLLFKAGSDKVEANGVTALAKLAKALNENPSIEIIVEGHTDNAGAVDYNWNLSVSRATSVVKILAMNGVLPNRMIASGRGMHHPIVPNNSEANKAKNRRTEIILSPNLDKILELTK